VQSAGGISKAFESTKNMMKEAGDTVKDLLGMNGSRRALDIAVSQDKLSKAVNALAVYSFYINTGATIGREVSNIVVAKKEKEVSLTEVDLKMIQAQLRMLNEIIDQITDLIQTLYESQVSTAQFVSEVVKMLKDSKIHIGRSLA